MSIITFICHLTVIFIDINVFTLALALAMSRDGSSGGLIRLASIEESGVERVVIAGDEIPRFFED